MPLLLVFFTLFTTIYELNWGLDGITFPDITSRAERVSTSSL